MSRRHFAAAMLLASTLAAPPETHAQSICGTRTHRPRRYEHVVWIWMENHNYGHVVGSPNAPYINGLIAECGLATNFHNLTHVSLPNYIGAVTGLGLSELQPFLMDCNPGGSCLTDANSLFAQVASWKAYMESMTTNCQMVGFAPYAVRHNPPPYLTSLGGCDTFDVPYPELQADLDADTLPAFAFISPNTLNDMHDGVDPIALQAGDTWLMNELPKILNSAAYQRGKTGVVVTFDEGEGSQFGEDCATNTTDESCHIPAILISPSVRPGTTSGTLFNHYSLLRTTEQMLGVRRRYLLGEAKRAPSMRRAFRF